MIRVVLDTNVLVSAALKPKGAEAYIVKFALARNIHLFATPAIQSEYDEVLSRRKFSRVDPNVIIRLLARIRSLAIPVSPDETLRI